MTLIKDIFLTIKSKIVINPRDDDATKAKKMMWYSFIGAILILIVLSLTIAKINTLITGGTIKVPMVVNDDIYEALAKLNDKSMRVAVVARNSDEVEAGRIISQNPKQGQSVRKGRRIRLVVSKGPKSATLADFVGYSLFELEDKLEQLYPDGKIPFKIDKPIYVYDDNVEKGHIIKQEPVDGVPIYNVKTVKVWISNGIKDDEEKVIDNYIGRKIDDVSLELADLELYYTYEYEFVNDKSEDMIITDQSFGKGMPVSDIIEDGKTFILKVKRYREEKGDKIKGTYIISVPKKGIPFYLEVRLKEGNNKEKTIVKRKLKGGVSLPVYYSIKQDAVLSVYLDNEFYKKYTIKVEELEGEN